MAVELRLHAGLLALACASGALADTGPVCRHERSGLPVERRLRQLTLDLLQRPPTMDEYRFFQAKGDVLEEDVRELLSREAFYERMKEYHRALLKSNVSTSVNVPNDTRLTVQGETGSLRPLGLRGTPATQLRGQNSAMCDTFIEQDQCNTQRQDPHFEPTTKICRDAMGVPLPVSVDYNTNQYQCLALSGASSCTDAVSRGLLDAKLLYFCDMRRQSNGSLQPFRCLPDSTKPQTMKLTQELLEPGTGRVVAFVNPAPSSGELARLDRCGLGLTLAQGVRGRYSIQPGCVQREGVVDAPAPYFEAASTAKLCAIEAQTRDYNPWTFETCESTRFLSDRSCGCGVASRRCDTQQVNTDRISAVNEEPLLIADAVLRRNEDYFSVLTTRRSFVNGPLAQLYRQSLSPTVWQVTAPASAEAIPNVPLAETSRWVEYTRDEQASGVLTTPSYLYRFPTARARVSQFWEAFLCKHFSPPPDAVVAPPEDSCNRENNLAKRCGCTYCHATIEPVGAHWGRFGERNAQYLNPAHFPRLSQKCRDCALAGNTSCDNECGNYVMQAFDGDGASSLGLLRTFLYRTSDEEPNIEGGPRLLVERSLQTGELEKCVVRNLWSELLGRPMTSEEERLLMRPLVDDFARSGHNLKELVLRIVTSAPYRRVD